MKIQPTSEIKRLFAKELLADRQIALYEEITHELVDQIGAMIMFLNAKDKKKNITLHIKCPGGNLVAALDLYDIVNCSEAPICGVVNGMAYSAAAVILQGCKTRQAYKHSEIMVHNVRSHEVDIDEFDPEFREKVEKFRSKHERRKKTQEDMLYILTQKTKRTRAEMAELCREEKKLSAEEALKYGFIDQIL